MKSIILILLSIVFISNSYSQTKKIAADVRNSPSDTYSLGYDSLYTGGFKVFGDTIIRNNILTNTPLVFKNGSFVFTNKDSTLWRLDSTHNPIWVRVFTGSIGMLDTTTFNQIIDTTNNKAGRIVFTNNSFHLQTDPKLRYFNGTNKVVVDTSSASFGNDSKFAVNGGIYSNKYIQVGPTLQSPTATLDVTGTIKSTDTAFFKTQTAIDSSNIGVTTGMLKKFTHDNYVPYIGAISNVDIGNHSLSSSDGTVTSQVYPSGLQAYRTTPANGVQITVSHSDGFIQRALLDNYTGLQLQYGNADNKGGITRSNAGNNGGLLSIYSNDASFSGAINFLTNGNENLRISSTGDIYANRLTRSSNSWQLYYDSVSHKITYAPSSSGDSGIGDVTDSQLADSMINLRLAKMDTAYTRNDTIFGKKNGVEFTIYYKNCVVTFSDILGDAYDNSSLTTALNAKQNLLPNKGLLDIFPYYEEPTSTNFKLSRFDSAVRRYAGINTIDSSSAGYLRFSDTTNLILNHDGAYANFDTFPCFSGFFRYSAQTRGTRPTASGLGFLINMVAQDLKVSPVGSGRIYQLAFDGNLHRMFYRDCNSGVWGAWDTLANIGDASTGSYYPLSGGDLTGTSNIYIGLPKQTAALTFPTNLSIRIGMTNGGRFYIADSLAGGSSLQFDKTSVTGNKVITWSNNSGVPALLNTGTSNFIDVTTDNLSEGSTNKYYTDSRARGSISLTTTGTSGAATYNNTTGVLNIPQYSGGSSGSLITSSASTLTLAYSNDYIFTGTSTVWTLPSVSGGTTGRDNMITIKNRGSSTITLNSDTGTTIYASSAVGTITISPGEGIMLMPDGTYFNVE